MDSIELCTSWTELVESLVYWTPPAAPQPRPCALNAVSALCQSVRTKESAHRPVSWETLLDGLSECFFEHRCGIFVSVRNHTLAFFQPFANASFRNTGAIQLVDPLNPERNVSSVDDYIRCKHRATGVHEKSMLRDVHDWWFNGDIVCNVVPPGVWGRSMFHSLCAMLSHVSPQLNDCDFILNKRDAPLNLRSIPCLSFYTNDTIRDLPCPLPRDWECSPCSTIQKSRWATRRNKAVFRGSSTGPGLTLNTNRRLQLAHVAKSAPSLLDVGITSFNVRDRVISQSGTTRVITCAATRTLMQTIPKSDCMTISDQASQFKYALYVAGHQAADRLGALLNNGFVVIHVEGDVLDDHPTHVWFWHSLKRCSIHSLRKRPRQSCHVISCPLSCLIDTVTWLNANPIIAFRIARTSQHFFQQSVLCRKSAFLVDTLQSIQPQDDGGPHPPFLQSTAAGTAWIPVPPEIPQSSLE